MPMAVGLGLPGLDRSFFGLRRTDRSSTNPSPIPAAGLSATEEEAKAPPELPPLGVSNWHTSFTNLLDQLEVVQPVKGLRDPHRPATIQFSTLGKSSSASSTKTLQQHDANSHQSANSMEAMTKDDFLSTLTTLSSKSIPERHQSSTSSTTFSKRSDSFSHHSVSSKSSVEDVPLKDQAVAPVSPIALPILDTGFLMDGFEDTKLDLELNNDFATHSPIFAVNTNKPLPLAPAAALRDSQAMLNGVPLPELDSAPVRKVTSVESNVLQGRYELGESEPKPVPNSQPLKLFNYLQTDSKMSKVASVEKPKQQKPKGILKKRVSPDMAEQVILGIFLNLNSITDLQATALINKGFYRVFKRHESRIVESVLRRSSIPAWELRQLVKREQKRDPFQMKAVQRDLAAIRALQAFMLMKCDKICRKSTLTGLVGENVQRRMEIENALWRIWTFCKLFGKGTTRDTGAHAQLLWLESNVLPDKDSKTSSRLSKSARPVSRSELEDMSEMWRCMELLLSGFRGREPEAREAGIFDQCKINEEDGKNETQYLEDWIYDILSVGPKAVLTMMSCSFEHAKVLGVNKWTPPRSGKSRRTFLKATLEQIYRDRLVEEARMKAERFARSMQQQMVTARPTSDTTSGKPATRTLSDPTSATRPISSTANGFSTTTKPASPVTSASTPTIKPVSPMTDDRSSENAAPAVEEKKGKPERLEIRPDCDPEASLPFDQQQIPTTSPTTNPASFSSLAMMSGASTRLGATLFPIQNNTVPTDSRSRESSIESSSTASTDMSEQPAVVDPIDRAMSLLVKQLGFSERLAKQALAMSDDGAGIDVQRAVELLSGDRRLESKPRESYVPEVTELPSNPPKAMPAMQQIKEYCEGTCRRVSLIHRRSSHLRGLMNRNSIRQSFRLSSITDREDEVGALNHLVQRSITPTLPLSMPTVHEDMSEAKSDHHNSEELIRYRNSLRLQSIATSPVGFVKGHQKSSSAGSVDQLEGFSTELLSPVSPLSPAYGMSGFATIASLPHQFHGDNEGGHAMNVVARPKVTLTRIGTGKKPSRRISFTKGLRRPGEPPEIIGYTY